MNNHHANERQPFAEQTAKREKRYAGRTDASHTPLELRSHGHRLDDDLHDWIYDRAGRQLGKFATHIERIVVRFDDENGPRGGVDCTCTVEVSLSSLPHVVVTEKGVTQREAFDRAAGRAERATRRSLERHGFSAKAAAGRQRHDQDDQAVEEQNHEGRSAENHGEQSAIDAGADATSSVRPPRKSTHGGMNGELPDSPLRLRAREALQTPHSKAIRAQARSR